MRRQPLGRRDVYRAMKRSMLVTGLVGLALAGCADPGETSSPGTGGAPSDDGMVGSVQLQLQIAGKYRLDTVTYHLTRGGYDRTGSLNVAASNTVSGLIEAVPAGTGYTIALAATDVGRQLTGCQGSSAFDVAPGVVTPVEVDLSCHEVRPPPVPVPIPRGATVALAVLLALAGAVASARRGRSKTERESCAR
jgi:hypothetical protein